MVDFRFDGICVQVNSLKYGGTEATMKVSGSDAAPLVMLLSNTFTAVAAALRVCERYGGVFSPEVLSDSAETLGVTSDRLGGFLDAFAAEYCSDHLGFTSVMRTPVRAIIDEGVFPSFELNGPDHHMILVRSNASSRIALLADVNGHGKVTWSDYSGDFGLESFVDGYGFRSDVSSEITQMVRVLNRCSLLDLDSDVWTKLEGMFSVKDAAEAKFLYLMNQ